MNENNITSQHFKPMQYLAKCFVLCASATDKWDHNWKCHQPPEIPWQPTQSCLVTHIRVVT